MSPSGENYCRVLYIEDTPEDQRMLAEAVGLAGVPVEIVAVSSADAAVAELAKGAKYHALVLDWNLPATTGMEFLTSVRLAHAKLPVLILTGEPATVDLAGAMQLGAESVIAKPITLDHWIRLARLLHGFCEDVQVAG